MRDYYIKLKAILLSEQVKISYGQIQLASESETPCLRVDESLHDQLDYWEVDPRWDGEIFRSAAQAARPLRKGKIPTELCVPTAGKRMRVRLVKINGEQVVLNI